jgi:hypothetical protein
MTNKFKMTAGALLVGTSALASQSAHAAKQLVCVFDPVGNSGDVFTLMKDFQAKSLGWGAEIALKAYTDEGIIVDELKAGKCDGAVLTGLKSRDFNKFASTIEAVGATTDDAVLRTALETVMSLKPKTANKFLRNGPYEVAGIMPAGAIYAFLRDRKWDSLDKIQGKRITVMEGDSVSQSMVRQSGGTPVVATTTSFAGKFNNGSVDITFAPAAAYEPLEMYRGLGEKGGVVDMVFSQLTFQFLIRHEKFPADFGSNARQTSLENFDGAFEFIDRATKTIDPKYWVKLNPKDKPGYAAMMRQSRIALRDKGVYDGKMLKILRKIRCKENPTAAECAENLE